MYIQVLSSFCNHVIIITIVKKTIRLWDFLVYVLKMMAEEQVDVEYISLHGYIRNSPSDTEVHEEQQLRVERGT